LAQLKSAAVLKEVQTLDMCLTGWLGPNGLNAKLPDQAGQHTAFDSDQIDTWHLPDPNSQETGLWRQPSKEGAFQNGSNDLTAMA
jgi:hypothetical protein